MHKFTRSSVAVLVACSWTAAGNLPDGTAFLLRSGGAELQPLRYPGRFKREGYSYPKSIVSGDYLYIAYATNKEYVEITRVPLASISRRFAIALPSVD